MKLTVPDRWVSLAVLILLIFFLLISAHYSYLLFHSLAEIFSIIIATTISILAWNSRKRIDNDYLLVIGIAFLAIAAVDLLHTLAFKGMNIFIGYDSNLPTQLWIVARYGQALTMLVAPLFLTRRANVLRVSVTAYAITAVLLLLIFHRLFFDCYVEGSGLTTFKVASEYVIIAVLFGAILYLKKKKDSLDREVYWLIQISIVFMMLSEFSFIQYVGVYSSMNALGHLFKVVEFYLLYLAILRTGISEPFKIMFKDLKESQEKIMATLNTVPVMVLDMDEEMRVRLVNKRVELAIGMNAKEMQGRPLTQLFPAILGERLSTESEGPTYTEKIIFEMPIQTMDGMMLVEWRGRRTVTGYLLTGLDVTEQRAAHRLIENMAENQRVVYKVLRHDLKNQLTIIYGYMEMLKLKGDPKYLSKMDSALNKGMNIIDVAKNLELALDLNHPLEEIDVRKIAESVISALEAKGVKIVIDGKLMTVADSAMSSVLHNLISNALLHASATRITVRMWRDDSGGHVEVEDDGKGIPKEIRENLFKEGVRGDSLGSSGMGLYLVRKIIMRYGGTVSMRDGDPVGTIFSIDLPDPGKE